MENFDKPMAVEVIEDALTNIDTAHGRGMATGLCGAFYMCGLLSAQEWAAFLKRIPEEHHQHISDPRHGVGIPAAKVRSRILN